jgi:KDO2-lipid IV(A) lauroyltransferase
MSRLAYHLIILPLSRIPLPILYKLSDLLFVILYRVFHYRRRVVMDNLRRSFPAFAEWQLQATAQAFYRHLGDLMVESVRMFSMPLDESRRRCRITNPELLRPYHQQGRSVILNIGHYNNWELMAQSLDIQIPHQAVAIYLPIKDQFFEGRLNASRGKHGLTLVPTPDIGAYVRMHTAVPSMYVLAGDQSPTYARRVHWTQFLHQETAVSLGTEFYAVKFNMPVVFGHIRKVSRGKYEMELRIISDSPREEQSGSITEAHVRALEACIEEAPEYWLWTHRRWKRQREQA